MSGGITTEGGRIVLDIDAIHRDHDVNDGDDNCRTCGVEYPCGLVEAVDQLAEWMRRQDVAVSSPAVETGAFDD